MQQVDAGQVIDQLGIEYFKNASTLGALSNLALEAVLRQGQLLELNQGDVLFKAGEKGDSFYVVLNGSIAYYRSLNSHKEYLRDYLFGAEIGFVSMVALLPRQGTAVANKESLVVKVTNDLFYELHCEHPLDFGILLLNLSREMARTIVTMSGMLAQEKHEHSQ
ncbi:Crp/Fnr family transcriptional regulator [Pontibacter sp. JAM-7]|uniref:Crp/Fnr family transcriptional regulator n=1 Tax=Pontibacter sp. JAM-7 TaxID=3366581 RepID=UPI003AF49943